MKQLVGINAIGEFLLRNSNGELMCLLVSDRNQRFTPSGKTITGTKNSNWIKRDEFRNSLLDQLQKKSVKASARKRILEIEDQREFFGLRDLSERALIMAFVEDFGLYPLDFDLIDSRLENGDSWIKKFGYLVTKVMPLSEDLKIFAYDSDEICSYLETTGSDVKIFPLKKALDLLHFMKDRKGVLGELNFLRDTDHRAKTVESFNYEVLLGSIQKLCLNFSPEERQQINKKI